MMRRLTIGGALVSWCLAASVLAQSSAPTRAAPPIRPPVFFSEGWKALSSPADDHGTWLVGDHTTGPAADFNEGDVSLADVRWLKLDIDRVVAVGTWIEHPNLTKVDEVGFADLMPGSGHGPGGYVNVGRIEVYGDAV